MQHLLNLIFPPRCLSCASHIATQDGICHICWGNLNFVTTPHCYKCSFPFEYDVGKKALCATCLADEPQYELARTVLIYDDDSSKLIRDFKYHDQTHGVKIYGKWLVKSIAEFIGDIDYIAPVPIHRKRLIVRKYNQSALLAKEVAKLTDKKFIPTLLHRIKHSPPQASLHYNQRKVNVKNCFAFNQKYIDKIKGKNILLLDDVITTGSTINQCVKILKNAGAEKIYVLTLAKTLR